ncbi:MAG TPA: hypothetical protein H9881_18820 [Candidatus Stackebrandtia excrementipullorum]|nr:hypothetical protein [Candidatus Stackebrandtia excrementipullorum]
MVRQHGQLRAPGLVQSGEDPVDDVDTSVGFPYKGCSAISGAEYAVGVGDALQCMNRVVPTVMTRPPVVWGRLAAAAV